MEKRYNVVRAQEGNVVEPPGEWIREIFSHEGLDMGIAEAKIREAKLHRHDKIHEFYYVLEGEGKVRVGEDIVHLKKGDFLHIPPGLPHKAFSDKHFKVLVISRPRWNPRDHHVLE